MQQRPRKNLTLSSNSFADGKMKSFLTLTFFVYFSDALISYTAPSLIEKSTSNNFVMGLIISLSSIAGLVSDILIPKLFANKNIALYFKFFFLFSLATSISLMFGTVYAILIIFGMISWGIYSDLLKFINFKLIRSIADSEAYSTYWGYHDTIRTTTVLIVPLVAIFLIKISYTAVFVVAIIAIVLGYFQFYSLNRKIKISDQKIPIPEKFRLDYKVLLLLIKPITPLYVFLISLVILDSSFWTIGILLAQDLSKSTFMGNFILPAYILPGTLALIFAGRLSTKIGKKRSAFTSAILGSIILFGGLQFFSETLLVIVVFVSSLFYSLCWPQINSAFEDYTQRVGNKSDQIISIYDSATNLGYIIGPILAGLLAYALGYTNAFKIISIIPFIFAIIGLITMKHKVYFSKSIQKLE